MASIAPDNVEYKLLGLLQTGFPLTREPYLDLGVKLGMTGNQVIQHIGDLKAKGIVRQISPVLDARKLGYQSTLIAMKVPVEGIGRAEQILSGHVGVSHAYERDNEYNIWFTLSVPLAADMQSELRKLSSQIGVEAAFALPAVRVFKLRTNFGPDEDSQTEEDAPLANAPAESVELSETERKMINALQEDLPLVSEPFREIAERLDISVEDLIGHCMSLLKRGVIRRYGASINHYKAGYKANAMTCWNVPHDKVEAIAAKISSLRQVSHCYERGTNYLWHYNLFVMIHGNSKSSCQDAVNEIRADSGINDFAVLFSTREFKKTRIRYPV